MAVMHQVCQKKKNHISIDWHFSKKPPSSISTERGRLRWHGKQPLQVIVTLQLGFNDWRGLIWISNHHRPFPHPHPHTLNKSLPRRLPAQCFPESGSIFLTRPSACVRTLLSLPLPLHSCLLFLWRGASIMTLPSLLATQTFKALKWNMDFLSGRSSRLPGEACSVFWVADV